MHAYVQAEKQLPGGWSLMRDGTPACPEIGDWLAENLPEGATVGVDPFLHTVRQSTCASCLCHACRTYTSDSDDTHRNKDSNAVSQAPGSCSVDHHCSRGTCHTQCFLGLQLAGCAPCSLCSSDMLCGTAIPRDTVSLADNSICANDHAVPSSVVGAIHSCAHQTRNACTLASNIQERQYAPHPYFQRHDSPPVSNPPTQ